MDCSTRDGWHWPLAEMMVLFVCQLTDGQLQLQIQVKLWMRFTAVVSSSQEREYFGKAQRFLSEINYYNIWLHRLILMHVSTTNTILLFCSQFPHSLNISIPLIFLFKPLFPSISPNLGSFRKEHHHVNQSLLKPFPELVRGCRRTCAVGGDGEFEGGGVDGVVDSVSIGNDRPKTSVKVFTRGHVGGG